MEERPKVSIVIEEAKETEKISLGEKRSSYRQKWAPFRRGRVNSLYEEQKENSHDEVDSLEQFYERITKSKKNHPLAPLNFDGWTFLNVNFSSLDKDEWNSYNFKGALFLGCEFPVADTEMQSNRGEVWNEPCKCPFKSFRSSLYSQQELRIHDDATYNHYLTHKDFRTKISQAIHDYSLTDALGEYLEGKTCVGVMGGHKLLRNSEEYRYVVMLALNLARNGFLICTGGGPGAMEAANLGGYLSNKTDEEIDLAMKLIASGGDIQPEYKDLAPPQKVIEALGFPDPSVPSLGIPTYRYGHEPTNFFSSHVAKFFDNAIREDGLLQISNGGLIFVRGAAGTRQEIFQSACHNHYNTPKNTRPMVFIGVDYWKESGVYDTFFKFAQPESYGKYALLSDDIKEIVDHLVNHAFDKEYFEK